MLMVHNMLGQQGHDCYIPYLKKETLGLFILVLFKNILFEWKIYEKH